MTFSNNFLECKYDGKIIFVGDGIKDYFDFINQKFLLRKRLFNLIHSSNVVDFISFYNSFLKSESLFSSRNFICWSNNSLFEFVFYFHKVNKILKVFLLKKKKVFFKNDFFSFFKNLFFFTRLKFVLGSLMPFFFSFLWCIYKYSVVQYKFFFILFLCLTLLHILANTFNDYFDWKSKRDEENLDYVLSSTGGSRAIDFNVISEKNMLFFSIFISLVVFLLSLYLFFLKGYIILIIGFFSFIVLFFYSAPPIHLASRYGMGELVHILCLGPLIIYGASYVFSDNLNYINFLVGFPHGFLITSCLLINEYADSKFDKISMKNNLAVFAGYRYIPYLYLFLVLFSFLLVYAFLFFRILPVYFLFVFFSFPYSLLAINFIFRFNNLNSYFFDFCLKSLNVYIYYSLTLLFSFIFFYP